MLAGPWESPFLPGHRKAQTSNSQLLEALGFLLRNALRDDRSCRGHLRTLQGGPRFQPDPGIIDPPASATAGLLDV